MAKTKTTYSSHPKLIHICAIVLTALTVISIVIFVILGCSGNYDGSYPFSFLGQVLMLGAEFFYFSSGWIEIDDDGKTLTISYEKKHPIDIMKIDRIARHIDKKGRVKYLTVHEVGVRYIDVRIRRGSDPYILESLKKINPAIEVVSYKD